MAAGISTVNNIFSIQGLKASLHMIFKNIIFSYFIDFYFYPVTFYLLFVILIFKSKSCVEYKYCLFFI